ncbi:MAG: methionyl-tRNA formyltransferase [Actinomycetia bacterium]|nr:methionyl-tRNA formyltransferase [Actinomycetes bacterium]
MRLAYFGTPADAVPPLEALVRAGHDVVLVVTQPDRRRGRGKGVDPSPVKTAATELGLTVLTPERAREVVDAVAASGAELGVVVAFGQILPSALLDAPPLGFVNLHFSLLPRWRGAAPVERAMLAGDAETGVAVMAVEPSLDTGPVYAEERVGIDPDESAGALRARLVQIGADLLVRTLPRIADIQPRVQEGEPTYAEKLRVDEFELRPRSTVGELLRLVRAGNPKPGAWFELDGVRVKVWRAHAAEPGDEAGAHAADPADEPVGTITRDGSLVAADGLLALDEVQPAGKRPMVGADWRRGLGSDPALVTPAGEDVP